jgi:hypothetical protein
VLRYLSLQVGNHLHNQQENRQFAGFADDIASQRIDSGPFIPKDCPSAWKSFSPGPHCGYTSSIPLNSAPHCHPQRN